MIEILKADYQRFPNNQTYDIYADDVYFEDPLNAFRGRDRYQRMIAFIHRWFEAPQLDLKHISADGSTLQTEWTLSWIAPFPWKPKVSISGHTIMTLNAEGLIASHIDYWHCSRWEVLKQVLPWPGEA